MRARIDAPPMGWNSFDAYGCAASEEVLHHNLDVLASRLKPAGYTYFVVDNGWFAEYDLPPGAQFPQVKHADEVRLDEYGRYLPSRCNFPNGIQPLIERTHALGLRFGIHIMRGISRQAVRGRLPILGTPYTAADIADLADTCSWCPYNYGVNPDHPGAQAYYQSVVDLLADWGVDFIKADDITGHPREVALLTAAIAASGREIALSLSPGGGTDPAHMDVYWKANLLRTTTDIWDRRADLDRAFDAWAQYGCLPTAPGFYLDLDMIPFGQLQIWNPKPAEARTATAEEELLGGKGWKRMCMLTKPQMYTFITMRALAASPLFMGGDLPTSDEFSFTLITNPGMIACNQNGITGRRLYAESGIEVWHTPSAREEHAGWIGVFNRNRKAQQVRLSPETLGLAPTAAWRCRDIWGGGEWRLEDRPIHVEIAADGVRFIQYERM